MIMFKNHSKLLAAALMAVCLLVPQFASAQTRVRASGTVTDTNGEPVIGVGIFEKGTTNGTASDANGAWTLNIAPGATLVFQSIGYYTQEIPVTASRTVYNVVLVEDTTMLEDVVVVGFGTQKKVNLTGSVSVATSEDIQSRPVRDASDALQGLLPGLQLTHNSGALDNQGTMTIRVRGTGTIGSGSADTPLILIDGMEGDINTINPQDIDNISVLKDAASASIYGSRAAFGVILITTKKGNDNRVSINYNNSFRFASPLNMPETMDSYTFALFFNSAQLNGGKSVHFSDATLQAILDFQAAGGTNTGGLYKSSDGKQWSTSYSTAHANTDWYHELYKGGVMSQEHNLSVSGGNRSVQYYASLGYLNYNGMLKPAYDGRDRFNVSAKFDAQITKHLTFGYSVRFIRQKTSTPSGFGNSWYEKVGRQSWPTLPVFDENGYYNNIGSDTPAMKLAMGGRTDAKVDQLYQQASLIFEPIKNWRTHVEFNYRVNTTTTRATELPRQNHDVAGNLVPTTSSQYLTESYAGTDYYNWNIYSDYAFDIQQAHNFKVMLGFQADNSMIKNTSVRVYGLQDVNKPVLSLTTGLNGQGNVGTPTISGTDNSWSTAGFFGRLNYDYKGRYLFEANLRYDGSSRFRADSRWTWAPSFSFGWNVAQEPFWQDFKRTVNMLKLRLSYGTLANQNTTGYYPTYRTMSLGLKSGSWAQNGQRPDIANVGSLISAGLTWEKVRTYNVGLDWGMFNNRFSGSAELYSRFTNDMVGPAVDLPATLGLSAPRANNCDLRTNGWEIEVSWRDRTAFGLGYRIAGNLSDSRTVILAYPGNSTGSLTSYNPGHEINEIWGYETVGIAKSQAEMDAHLEKVGGQSAIGSQWAAGDIMYADLDGKPGITRGARTLEDHGDLKLLGTSNPHYFFGINLEADFKGFDVRALFQGVAQRQYFPTGLMFWGATGSGIWWSAGFKEHGDYFRATEIGLPGHTIAANTDSYYPRPLFSSKNEQTQTRYLLNAAYIRFKNLQFGYTLPQDLTRKININRCRIFVSVDNLWTGTALPKKLLDPETINGGYGSYGNAYPLARTWSFGLSVTL